MRSGIVAMATMCAFSSGIIAAELPKSGPIEGRWFSYNMQTIEEMETADNMKAYVTEAIGFDAGRFVGDLEDSTTERCLSFGRYSEETGAVHEIGRCTLTDRDGDKFFNEYVIDLTGPDDKSPNEAKLIGGTGKYKGIQGTIMFTVDAPLPAIGKSKTMWTGEYKGEYKIAD
jgi:hypothetical protein